MMHKTLQGVCSHSVSFDVDDKNLVRNVSFTGGCHGNLQAVSRLVEGRSVDEVIDVLEGITCGKRNTSCADQFARSLQASLGEAKEAKEAKEER